MTLNKIKWSVEKRNIADLKPAVYNPRKLTKDQKKQIDESLQKFGLAEPIIINKNNTVIGGHQRLKIIKSKNIKEIDVSVPDRLLDDDEEKELNLRLNKNLGEWDFDLLTNNFELDLLENVGFTNSELKIDFESNISDNAEINIDPILQVLVECECEQDQEKAFALLKKAGFNAKILSI